MNELIDKIVWTRENQKDLFTQIQETQKIIRKANIKNVFTNYSNEYFLSAFVLESSVEKVVLNSLDIKHFKEWGKVEKCKFINQRNHKLVIKPYELVQLDVNHYIDDWSHFSAKMVKRETKVLLLNNFSSKSEKEKDEIIKSFYQQDMYVHKMLDGYYGCLIMVNEEYEG